MYTGDHQKTNYWNLISEGVVVLVSRVREGSNCVEESKEEGHIGQERHKLEEVSEAH
jgi:hypothetical protein